MKLTCFQCGYQWNRRYDRNPACCPKCGNNWRKPSWWVKLKAAYKCYQDTGKPSYRPRVGTAS